ncbi:MAG: flagellar hook-associated protein FlgL [Chthonomonas sp.]|nr:flagellar hook-associated protein FlgL [Chthonomonas sp.]
MERLSTRYQYDSYLSRIHQAYGRMAVAQDAVTSGKRPDLVKNDPAGASFVMRSTSLKAATEQYKKNLSNANDYLKFSEAALGDIHDLLKQGYSLAIQGASSATDQVARNTMAKQVEALQTKLLELGNTRGASGQYIFAGTMSDTKPFTTAAGSLVYNGDSGFVKVEIGPGETLDVNTPSNSMMLTAYTALEGLRNSLTGGNISLLSGQDIANLQLSMDAVKSERGVVGSRLQYVQEQSQRHDRRIDDLTKRISDVEDVDMAQAITDYQLAQTVYQAALQSSAMAERLSLMDFIR